MALSDEAIRHLLEWFATSSQTDKKWFPKRKAAEVENHRWIQPSGAGHSGLLISSALEIILPSKALGGYGDHTRTFYWIADKRRVWQVISVSGFNIKPGRPPTQGGV